MEEGLEDTSDDLFRLLIKRQTRPVDMEDIETFDPFKLVRKGSSNDLSAPVANSTKDTTQDWTGDDGELEGLFARAMPMKVNQPVVKEEIIEEAAPNPRALFSSFFEEEPLADDQVYVQQQEVKHSSTYLDDADENSPVKITKRRVGRPRINRGRESTRQLKAEHTDTTVVYPTIAPSIEDANRRGATPSGRGRGRGRGRQRGGRVKQAVDTFLSREDIDPSTGMVKITENQQEEDEEENGDARASAQAKGSTRINNTVKMFESANLGDEFRVRSNYRAIPSAMPANAIKCVLDKKNHQENVESFLETIAATPTAEAIVDPSMNADAKTALGIDAQVSNAPVVGDRVLSLKNQDKLKQHLYAPLLQKAVLVAPEVNPHSYASHISTMLGPGFFQGIKVYPEGCRVLRPRRVSEAEGPAPSTCYGFYASPEYDAQYLFTARPYRILLNRSPLQAKYPHMTYLDIFPAVCSRGSACVGATVPINQIGDIPAVNGRQFTGEPLLAYADPSVTPDEHAVKAKGNMCLLCLRNSVFPLSVLRASEDSRVVYSPDFQPIVPFWNSPEGYLPEAMLYPGTRDFGIIEPVVNGLFQYLVWRNHKIRGPYISQELIVTNPGLYGPEDSTSFDPQLAPIFNDVLDQKAWEIIPGLKHGNAAKPVPGDKTPKPVSTSNVAVLPLPIPPKKNALEAKK